MTTIITLEVGEQAIPVVDVSYTDPTTQVLVTLPTKDAIGVVLSRFQVSVDIETDLPIYSYQIQFTPAVTALYVVPADPEDPESVDEERSVTVDVLGMDNSQLGLTLDEEPIIDVVAIQQTVNESKQISQASLNTATAINNELQQLDPSALSFGRSEINSAVETMIKSDADISTRDVIGLSDEDLTRKGQENKITSELLSSDQQISLEYIDNLFAFREVLVNIDNEVKANAEESNVQVLRGLEEDQLNADAFNDSYLSVPAAQNSFVNPEGFDYPVEEQNSTVYPNFSEIATLMNSSLLNPETNPIPVVVVPPDTSGNDVVEEIPFEPIIPPGTEE